MRQEDPKRDSLSTDPKRQLRIVIGSLEVGGAEVHLSHVLPALAHRGWKIQLLVLSDKVSLKDKFCHPNIEIRVVPSFSSALRIFERAVRLKNSIGLLLKSYNEEPWVLTHFFLPSAYLLGRLVGFLSKARGPWVMSRRSLRLYQKKWPGMAYLERFLHRRCARILVNSQKIKEELVRFENVPFEKITLIYNGLPLAAVGKAPIALSGLNLPSEVIVLVHVANFIPYKGHLDLLRALGLLKSQIKKDWVLLLIGRGEIYQKVLEEEAKKQKIDTHIRWVTDCSNTGPYLKIAHIGVLPSHQEGFSNALLEKMAAGLPVVATSVGGNGEAIVNNETGLLVLPHSPELLATALKKLIEDSALGEAMGQKGKERFQSLFTLERCVRDYEAFYKSQWVAES